VNIEPKDGGGGAVGEITFSNSTAWAARASRWGVVGREYP